MTPTGKDTIKNLIGEIPFAAELYWLMLQKGKPLNARFSLRELQPILEQIGPEINVLHRQAKTGRKVYVFATLHYWIEHAALLSAVLAAKGYRVRFGYLPYADWQKEINLFDLKRQNAYARKILSLMSPAVDVIPLIANKAPYVPLPDELSNAVKEVTSYDVQYTLQQEEVDTNSELYKLRYARNRELAQAVLNQFRHNRPDVAIVPNGTIQELGIFYRVARYLKVPVTTYEFSDQRQRMWLAQNSEVMRQDTNPLWQVTRETPLTEAQMDRMRSLMMARQRGSMWENFQRLWQGVPAEGGMQARAKLGLDERPVVLLATNVLGDSLTLGRQVFSKSMAEWISRTVQYFIGRPDSQLVIRVHPGEVLTHGQSMVDVVEEITPKLPDNIRLIKPRDQVNTYDLVEVADLGLVYTTTVGMEMAMNGVPVVVAGATHYRDRGFTYDPDSWVAYYKQLGAILEDPKAYRLSVDQVHAAWNYAYRFFFEYPQPFPWHLVRLGEDYKTRPLKEVLEGPNHEAFERTFRYLAGEKIDWTKLTSANGGE